MLPAPACYLVAPLGPFVTLSRSRPTLGEALLYIKGGWRAHRQQNPAQQCPAAGGGPGLRHPQQMDFEKASFSLHRCVFSSHLDFKLKKSLPGKPGVTLLWLANFGLDLKEGSTLKINHSSPASLRYTQVGCAPRWLNAPV